MTLATFSLKHRIFSTGGFWLFLFFMCETVCAQTGYVETTSNGGDFVLARKSLASGITLDPNDFEGVMIAAQNLQSDIAKVTGQRPEMIDPGKNPEQACVIIGTIGRSHLVDKLIRQRKIDVSRIKGKWESFLIMVVPKPFPGVANALVICGSDKRGTIYGIYDLSEKIGVSPWYFWEDVAIRHQDELYVKPVKFEQGPPAVTYRGIFLNDEAPDLTGWVKNRYGNYNHAFYTNVFELLLRLKANYLWPAMWDNCFNEDDPLNPKLADEYGIVMGTSHVEPMMRADKEWNRAGYKATQWNYEKSSNELSAFWTEGIERNRPYESIITIAMRGKIDTPMSESANISLLEAIVADQRKLIAGVFHTNAAPVPQLWALYKEVQEYYEKGMRVPDDVTLLWCDDNWGDIRRLPAESERARVGGAGVYYHFDYVGGPRNYKWVNTSPLPKVWEQMNLAYYYGANRIWIVNVGHLHHVALPMEFFLRMAWDPGHWSPDSPGKFVCDWARRKFGKANPAEIADIVSKYAKYNGRRKPELLDPSTFSMANYSEAERVSEEWNVLVRRADQVARELPADARDSFFELVLYPVKACANLNELYFTVAKNRLYASQGRSSANLLASRARELFEEDAKLSAYYNDTLAGGKWKHMMDQTHIGYTGWQQPPTNVMPDMVEISLPEVAQMGVAVKGSTNIWTNDSSQAVLPQFDSFNQSKQFVDIYNRGKSPFSLTVEASDPWILLNNTGATVDSEIRLAVSIDWAKVPPGKSQGHITISDGNGHSVHVEGNVFNPKEPGRKSLQGFVETDGVVSMEAEHFTRCVAGGSVTWGKIPDYGSTLSGMTTFPVTAPSSIPPTNSACLEYQMYLFDPKNVEVESILSPSLNFVAGRGLRFALSFDDQAPQMITAVPEIYPVGDGAPDWEKTVRDGVRRVKTNFVIGGTGYHTLKFWRVDPGVVLEKIVVNLGGKKPSYFGPPESFHNATK